MLKRRTKKLSKNQAIAATGRKWLECSECNVVEISVNSDIGRVTCPDCVQKIVAPPENYTPVEKSDKPRGWHLKRFFEHKGVVYSRGKEVTDAAIVEQLRQEFEEVVLV